MKRAACALLLLLTFAVPARLGGQTPPGSKPKLVVFIVVDQLRGDYPVRYADLLEHGLKRLTTRGAWFRNAAYPYQGTITCPGHATIGTGTFPYRHGMIANAWYDRDTEKAVTCNSDPDSLEVSYATSAGPGDTAKRMMVPTLAELMRGELKSRVATMSMKARSAIGLAGHAGDFVTWFGDRGAWETSNAYTDTPVPWFVGYLKGNPVTRDADKVWERALPVGRYQFEDDVPYERGAAGWTAAFPHPLGRAGDTAFTQHWTQSPFADTYLGEMAEKAVDDMHLGTEDRVDFLGVSFSMTDAIGHAFGPRSHEIQDTLARVDITIGKLLDHLDKTVGPDNYIVAFSADHGVADFPEVVAGAGRQSMAAVRAAVETTLKPRLGGEEPFIAATSGGEIYMKPGVYDRLKGNDEAIRALRKAITALPGVMRVLTADEVSTEAARSSKDRILKAVALSYYPGRSGDLMILPKENWLLSPTGTTHGSAHPYDQRVPVVLYGAGIQPGVRNDDATPADLAVTIASIVGVRLPSPDGKVLTSAFKKR
jgi:predicted AlkP superfamily pyrophosphatase or phosphodiesterase